MSEPAGAAGRRARGRTGISTGSPPPLEPVRRTPAACRPHAARAGAEHPQQYGFAEFRRRRRDSSLMASRAFAASPSPVVRAPGRVNLIGEHIDYCGLPVFPMALRQGVRITFHPRTDREAHLVNRDPRFAPCAFAVNGSIPPAPAGDWGNYARAAAQALAQRFPDLRGVDALVESDLPIAAGLSSSSALLVAMALAIMHANGVSVPSLELMELLGRGERYVGTAGGGMDQAIILGARAGCASRIDFHPLRLTPTPLPADWQFLVAWSLGPARKARSGRQAPHARAGGAGARLTGAGFGGSIVALCRVERAPEVVAALRERFYAPRGAADDVGRHVFMAEPSAGAEVMRA